MSVKWRAPAALAFAAVVISSAAAAAEQQAFRCPTSGTKIEFTDGTAVTFTGQDGMWCLATDSQKRPVRSYAMLAPPGSPLVENQAERIWPLEIGKEIEFKAKVESKHVAGGEPYPSYYEQFRIGTVRRETITVQAGTFDTWVIEIHESALGKVEGSFLKTLWYAPEVGFIVKSTTHVAMGIGQDSGGEAKRITRADASTNGSPAPSQPAPANPSAASPQPGTNSVSAAARLRELKSLLDQKLITQQEYDVRRKAILDNVSGPVK